MTRDEIRRLFPNASQSTFRANDQADCPRQNTVLEPNFRVESLASHPPQKGAAGRILIRMVSVRQRLCDPDNLSCKYLLDSLRYVGLIPGDEPEKIKLEVDQRRTEKGESEHTTIEITYP